MIKPKGLLLIGISFVLMFSVAGFLSAAQNGPGMARRGGGPGMGPRMGPDGMFRLQHMARWLELTDEQKTQIREILEENRNQLEQTRRNVIQARENLDAGSPETAEALGTAHAEAALLRAQIHEQIMQLLTTEQLERLKERRQLRKERLEEFPGRFGRAGKF